MEYSTGEVWAPPGWETTILPANGSTIGPTTDGVVVTPPITN